MNAAVEFGTLVTIAVFVLSAGIYGLICAYAGRQGDPVAVDFKVVCIPVAIVTGAALFVLMPARRTTTAPAAAKLSSASTPAAHIASSAGSGAALHPAHTPAAARAAPGRLAVLADARVWICLQDQRGQFPINGQVLPAGAISPQFVSPAFRIFLGNAAVRLRINGHLHSLPPPSPNPPAYAISQRGITRLHAVERCASARISARG